MKELYTIAQELQNAPVNYPLEFEEAVRIVDWLSTALYADKPAEDVEE